MELSLENVALFILTQFVISFPIGFLLLNNKIKNVPFIIKLPIHISLGMVVITILLFGIGIVLVHHYILIIIGIIAYSILLIKLLKKQPSLRPQLTKKLFKQNYDSIIFLVFFILVFFHFSSVAGYMGWPPAGDIEDHGLITSLIQHNGKFQTSMSPLWPSQTIQSPAGLHIVAADYSSLFEIFPGESFFVIGTAIVILIIVSVFSTVYILTRSLTFSTLAMVTTFYIHPSGNLERWLVGYYYNGPYPNLFSYLILFLFIIFWLYLPKDERKDYKFKILILATVLGFLVAYPPFVILPAIFIIIELIVNFIRRIKLKKIEEQTKHWLENKKIFSRNTLPFWSTILLPVIALDIAFLNQIQGIAESIRTLSYAYHISYEEYFMDYSVGLVILALIFSFHLIFQRKYVRLSIFYLVFSSILILCTQQIVFDKLWFLLTGRLFPFLYVFSWIMLLLYTNEMIQFIFKRKPLQIVSFISNLNLSRLIKSSISILLISILFYGPLISHATFEEAEKWAWFPRSEFFQNDYYLLEWLSKNTETTDLLMTDYSYTSRFIHSFSIKNVTASEWYDSKADIGRAKEGQSAWANPQLLPNYLAKYNVKFVVLNSEWGYRDALMLDGDDTYKEKKYSVEDYGLIFSQFPFLEKVKEVGPSAVYKVAIPELDEFLSKDVEIYDFSTAIGWQKLENPNKFTLLTDDIQKFSVKYNNASNTSLSFVHNFDDDIDTVSLKNIRWINLSVNATKPTEIELFLRAPSYDYYLYQIKIDYNELQTGKIENITIPIASPNAIYNTPDLSQMGWLQITLKSSSEDNFVTFHKIILTG